MNSINQCSQGVVMASGLTCKPHIVWVQSAWEPLLHVTPLSILSPRISCLPLYYILSTEGKFAKRSSLKSPQTSCGQFFTLDSKQFPLKVFGAVVTVGVVLYWTLYYISLFGCSRQGLPQQIICFHLFLYSTSSSGLHYIIFNNSIIIIINK